MSDQIRLQNTRKHLLLVGFTALPGLEGVSGPRTGRNVERHPISVFGCRFPIAGPTVTRGIRPTRSSVAFKATIDLTPPGLTQILAFSFLEQESHTQSVWLVASRVGCLGWINGFKFVHTCSRVFDSKEYFRNIFVDPHCPTVQISSSRNCVKPGGCDLAAQSVVCDRWWVIFSGEGGKSF